MNTQNGITFVTEGNFRTEVLESKVPVLVEFWTSWSQACRVSESVLEEIHRELAGTVKVVKVDADASLALSFSYDIQSIPTLIYFAAGKREARIVGTATKEAILSQIKPGPNQTTGSNSTERTQ